MATGLRAPLLARQPSLACEDRAQPEYSPRPYFFPDLTNPSAFLMFCTLGREILSVFAISIPVFPPATSIFTCARVSSVIVARLRRPRRPRADGDGDFPRGRPRRRPVPPPTALTAAMKSTVLANPYRAGSAASSLFRVASIACSSSATLAFNPRSCSSLPVIMAIIELG